MEIVSKKRDNSSRMKIVSCLLVSVFVVFAGVESTDQRRPRRQLDDARLAERIEPTSASIPSATSDVLGSEVATGNAIPGGLGWLDSNQNPSGSWGSTFEFADTATVVDTLGLAQHQGQPFNLGAGWLIGHLAADNDELARKMLALDSVTALDLDALADQLLGSRNAAGTNPATPNYPEGGWGLEDGYETDSLTTALALMALEATGRKAGIGVVNEPLAPGATNVHTWEIATDAVKARIKISVGGSTVRLRMKQGTPPTMADPYFPLSAGFTYELVFPDSGLPFTPGTNYISVESPNPPGTAATYSLTASYETADFDTRAFAEALAYIRQTQNPDGGWGVQIGDATSLYTTVHVMLALQRYRDYDFDDELADAVTYLLGEQLPDGSFGAGGGGVAYLTALAALNLIQHEVCPFSVATENAISALLAMRSMNGSWSGEPYDTSLALRALWEYDSDGDGVFVDGDCSGVAGDNLCQPGMMTGCDDNCVDHFNSGQDPVVFGQTIDLPNRDKLSWPEPADIAFVKGDLLAVNVYNVIAFGTASYATFLDIAGDSPPVQGGFYYLVRPAGDCSVPSWQTVLGEEPGRDIALRGEIDVVITSPADGAVLVSSPATVSGTVNGTAPVTVTVNGVPATVMGGTFSAPVPLVRGANTIAASGTDAAGFMGSDQISVTLVDHSIARGSFATGMRIFTAASTVLDQAAYFTESQSGVPAGVTYTTTAVQRISATQMRVSFRIDVGAGAALGLHFFQVTYGLLDAGFNPLGPLSGNVFDFEIEVRP